MIYIASIPRWWIFTSSFLWHVKVYGSVSPSWCLWDLTFSQWSTKTNSPTKLWFRFLQFSVGFFPSRIHNLVHPQLNTKPGTPSETDFVWLSFLIRQRLSRFILDVVYRQWWLAEYPVILWCLFHHQFNCYVCFVSINITRIHAYIDHV